MTETPACVICRRTLWDDELDRYTCRICTSRIDRDLAAIAGTDGLYAQLDDVLASGSGNGGLAVSGSRTAPLPLRLDILNAMTEAGPILAPLETWVRDWESYGHADLCEAGTLQKRADHAVGTLRFNLEWAVRQHAAIDEFAREISHIVRTCRAQIGGEKGPRRIPVTCACGSVILTTIDTRGETCPGCSAQYGHTEALSLPLAERRIAA
ncbi:hypothetical protein NLX86_18945 [Streptomyces sp. A3M-1-3]|uniref:hypothetical protein n=1 Tax=Streptomyces sp. A3M-1-3 TaxID=2962044 RepID=UPI0020B745B2|nr:hypothetical protein [Streptomyces sp. A3M-1-3]MCP3820096.1 hypothetical protein [Streptomyces sp. A3M-1-3]